MDFKKSFKKSLTEAKKTAKDKSEINLVFDELNKQINEISQEQISIIRQKQINLPRSLLATYINTNDESNSNYNIIGCLSKNRDISRKLANWKTSPEGGFPCTLSYSEKEIMIFDQESLITELQNLIGSPHSGIIFNKLLNEAQTIK